MKIHEIDDGRKDCFITVNGEKALIIPQEFVEKIGYEAAKSIMAILVAQMQLIFQAMGVMPIEEKKEK